MDWTAWSATPARMKPLVQWSTDNVMRKLMSDPFLSAAHFLVHSLSVAQLAALAFPSFRSWLFGYRTNAKAGSCQFSRGPFSHCESGET